jgi:HEAT repeat protein
MQSQDSGVRSAVARAIGHMGKPVGVPYLLELMRDETPRPRIAAIRALGHLGSDQHLAPLKPLLTDPDVAVRVTAAGAIGRLLGGPKKERG